MEDGSPPISMLMTHLYQEVTTECKHGCKTVPDPLGPQTGGLSSVPAVTGGGGTGFSAAQKLSLWQVLVVSPSQCV